MPDYGIQPADAGGGLLPWIWAVERLSKPRNYFVCTVRPDGRPHAMAVWGIWLDDKFCFSTAPTSTKARNFASNANCVVCPEPAPDIAGRPLDESVVLEGAVQPMTDKAALERFADVYKRKYDWEMDTSNGSYFAVRPRAVFAFGAKNDFAGTATRWTFGR